MDTWMDRIVWRVQRRLERTLEDLALLMLSLAVAFLCKQALVGSTPLFHFTEQDFRELKQEMQACSTDIHAILKVADRWYQWGILTHDQALDLADTMQAQIMPKKPATWRVTDEKWAEYMRIMRRLADLQ